MDWKRAAFAWMMLGVIVSVGFAQNQGVSEKLLIHASSASTWTDKKVRIVQLEGPVRIEMDSVTLTAGRAVVWLTPVAGATLGEQLVDFALFDDAELKQAENHISRSGPRLFVSGIVRATPMLTAEEKRSENLSESDLYKKAAEMRKSSSGTSAPGEIKPGEGINSQNPGGLIGRRDTFRNTPPPTTAASPAGAITFDAKLGEQVESSDGNIAMVLRGKIQVTQERDTGDLMELMAENIVLFTDIKWGTAASNINEHIVAAYLEGDGRINMTPALSKKPEQRITADRIYYDLVTDRAVLTDIVIHTIDPAQGIPVIVRAAKARQLSTGEYTTEDVELTTSAFALPTYSIRAGSAYVREYTTPEGEADTEFNATNDRLAVYGFPIFWFPYIGGTINNDAFPLREISFGNSNRFGVEAVTDWGLFESLGRPHPDDLDIDFHLDYFSERGPAAGVNGKYKGSKISDTARDPWSFEGDLKSYIMTDKGKDQPGGARLDVTPPQELRGQILWEHQHFFPGDWQIQARAGYVSDPTFLEEFYKDEFDDGLPHNASLYVKRQRNTEAITFLAQADTTTFITNAEQQQEQFDVERLPEITYRRIGDGIANDNLTFFSTNSASRLRFDLSHDSLLQQGYYPGLSPGLAAQGYTGTTGGPVYRADTKQEIDWPVQAGMFKFVPYVQQRVTEYSDSPTGANQIRFFTSAGVRATTAFWKVDNAAESELFDIHRVRHVIQPELNLFTSGSSVTRSDLFIYDPNVDAINDVNAAQIALHQRWQTQRGGPGRWRNVDFLELNVEGNFFTHQPPKGQLNPPAGFRGLYFASDPEASIPRQSINADATWRVSDTTAFLSDAQWNLDQQELATAAAGLAVTRGDRLAYFFGDRYIQALRSQILTFSAEYELTMKYRISVSQSFNFGDTRDVNTGATLTRAFDTVSASVSIYHNAITGQSGFNFNIFPLGFAGKTGNGFQSLQTR